MTVTDKLDDAKETHETKNADYGSAWLTVGELMHTMADGEPVVLDSPEAYASIGLYWERLIKLQRAFNGEFNTDTLNHESIRDSHEDNINYAAMHATLRE